MSDMRRELNKIAALSPKQMKDATEALLDRPVKPRGIVVTINGKQYHVPNAKAAAALRRRLNK